MSPKVLRALALGAVAAAVVGCGDDSDDVSAEELVSRGDEICREGHERFAEVQADSPQNADEALKQTEELADAASDELEELRKMVPPEELRDRYDSYLAAREEAVALLERGRDAAADGDAGTYADAQTELELGRRERTKLARAVGFEDCSGG